MAKAEPGQVQALGSPTEVPRAARNVVVRKPFQRLGEQPIVSLRIKPMIMSTLLNAALLKLLAFQEMSWITSLVGLFFWLAPQKSALCAKV
ncbi:MAG: hypothetical protein LBR80_07090 [Deltaproteobacteria bacterium]|nr:hypothetical protein [Deltaproteobacteria bacterium]